MNVSIGERWHAFVERVVSEGRYGLASEVVREGLPLVEEREAKLLALRAALDDSIVRAVRSQTRSSTPRWGREAPK